MYRYNAKMEKDDAFKINQTFGLAQAGEEDRDTSKIHNIKSL